MVTKRAQSGKRRFTIGLTEEEYARVKSLASGHRPPMTLQYVVEYAVQRLLDQAGNDEFVSRMADPLRDNRKEERRGKKATSD